MAQHTAKSRRNKIPAIRLTERDIRILQTIYLFDGVLSLNQIDRLFFNGLGRTQPRARMRALANYGYVATPAPSNRHRVPVGETVYWLTRQGADVVAGFLGVSLAQLKWRWRPRWSWLAHDLRVNDVRIAITEACCAQAHVQLGQWVVENDFLVDPDTVTYTDRNGKPRKRQVRPDGFFRIERADPRQRNEPQRFGFLLEVDMATESNPRFAREKVGAGLVYIQGDVYRQRFGVTTGAWLVVTTTPQRLARLKETVEQVNGHDWFYFTTFEQVSRETVLTAPIWQLAGARERVPLLPSAR